MKSGVRDYLLLRSSTLRFDNIRERFLQGLLTLLLALFDREPREGRIYFDIRFLERIHFEQ